MQDFGPRILGATPSYALNIAEVARAHGRRSAQAFAALRPLAAPSPGARRCAATSRQNSAIKAQDIYGLSEIIGPGGRQRMPQAQSGLHVWEDHFFARSSIPDTGARSGPGETGELVITTLTKEALPMFRYRTRDITRLHRGAMRLRAHPPAHDARHGPQRRHADHPRRQRLSVAGRGSSRRLSRACPALSDRAHAATGRWTR